MSRIPGQRGPGQFGGSGHDESRRLSSARGGKPRGRHDSGCALLVLAAFGPWLVLAVLAVGWWVV